MKRQGYRVLAVGSGTVFQEALLRFPEEGFSVTLVKTRETAQRLLDAGGFDLVLLEAANDAGAALLPKRSTRIPRLVLHEAPSAAGLNQHAYYVQLPVLSGQLLGEVNRVLAKSAARKRGVERSRQAVASAISAPI